MAIHKIKAKDEQQRPPAPAKSQPKPKTTPKTKKPFILIRPLVTLARYFRDSWRELRKVQWPTRRFTWKMTLSVILFVALFALLITVLDLLFTLLFTNIIK